MVQLGITNVFSTGGTTLAGFTKNGDKLLVAGSHGVIRVYKTGHDDVEPDTLDILDEISDLAIAGDDKFAVSSKDGEVELYSIDEKKSLGKVVRSALPIRGICFTHNDSKIVAAGDDDEVQIADLRDISKIIKFKSGDQVHDVSYNKTRDLLSLSLSNGEIKIFSLSSEDPKLVASIKDEIASLIYQDDDEFADDNVSTVKVQWHPSGTLFAVPSQNRTIKVFDSDDGYAQSCSFVRLHEKPITALEWCASGNFIASADSSNRLIIWDAESRKPVVDERLSNKVFNLSWSRGLDNKYDLVAGSENGDIFHFRDIVEEKKVEQGDASVLDQILAEDAEEDISENEDGEADDINLFSEASQDGADIGEDLRDFVDDDGFIDEDEPDGYAIPKKRPAPREDDDRDVPSRPTKSSGTRVAFGSNARKFTIKPYSPGCTPYIGDRRYLTINSVGYVSSVKQETHHSITVSFFDTSMNREYHFDDLHGYDVASLSKEGLLLGFSGKPKEESRILYRPHDNIADSWEKVIPTKEKEIVTSVSLSDSIILVSTSSGYMRSFSLFGIPQSIQKTSPIVASATNTNYIFTVSLSNQRQLIYNLQDLEGRFLQRDLVLPMEFSPDVDLFRGVFFSTYGDPIIVDNDGVVLVLARWRSPLQARWVPLLESDVRVREVGGKGDLRVWPLGLHGDNLSCIIIRGSVYPNYPLPLPSEMEVRIPLGKETVDDAEDPEEELVRAKTMGELLGETLSNEGEIFDGDEDRVEGYAISFDRALLKLFVQACSEEKNAKAWKLAQDLKQDKALEAAAKVAERVGLVALVNRVNKLREQRMDQELE
jgi:chromosome transmission fidelity protein 4